MQDNSSLLEYDLGEGVRAFSTRRESQLHRQPVQAHQVHGTEVAYVPDSQFSREELEGYDALVTDRTGVAIAARSADCVPVLLFDPRRRVVAAVHSGWRGTVQRISRVVVEYMQRNFSSKPEDIRAIVGPAIALESFQVGDEVVEAFSQAGFQMTEIMRDEGERVPGCMRGGKHIDLHEAVRMTLEQAGLRAENIRVHRIDTYLDGSFFSARREGTHCGRILSVIMLK